MLSKRAEDSPKWAALPRPCGPHAESVGVVDEQQRVVPVAQCEDGRQRRDIAIHAEHAVGDHQLALARMLFQFAGQACGVGVRIHTELGAGQARAVQQAGVIEAVGQYHIAFADQGRDDADIGHVATGEVQGARHADKARQRRFERLGRAAMTADHPRYWPQRRRRSRAAWAAATKAG